MIILEHIQAIYEKKNIQKKVFSIEKKKFLPTKKIFSWIFFLHKLLEYVLI